MQKAIRLMSGYEIPMLDPGQMPGNLVPEAKAQRKELTPETPVVIRNRGLRTLRDKFDGLDYAIPAGPGTFWLPYGAAKHFQARLIIPGTRNGVNGFQSYIAILGIDPPDQCEMFDQAEFDRQQAIVEGLDRSQLDPERQDVKVLTTATARAGIAGQGAGRRVEIHGASRDEVLSPPSGGSVARQEEAEARAEGYRPGQLTAETGQAADVEGRELVEHREDDQPQPAPMRGQKGRR